MQLEHRARDLAPFNLAIDSKLRGCDLVALRVDDVAPNGYAIDRANVRHVGRWHNYRPRQGDIVVATYPKCGTTWMQQIVSLLIFQSPEPRNIGEIGPWVDRRISPPVETMFAALDAQTHRRFMKAHLPFDGLPSFDEVRYIHVARDGRDACLSYHIQTTRFRPEVRAALDRAGMENETLRRPYPQIPGDAADYFRMWVNEGVGGGADGTPFLSYFGLEQTYWARTPQEQRSYGALSRSHGRSGRRDAPRRAFPRY